MKCTKCGGVLPGKRLVCPYCGEEQHDSHVSAPISFSIIPIVVIILLVIVFLILKNTGVVTSMNNTFVTTEKEAEEDTTLEVGSGVDAFQVENEITDPVPSAEIDNQDLVHNKDYWNEDFKKVIKGLKDSDYQTLGDRQDIVGYLVESGNMFCSNWVATGDLEFYYTDENISGLDRSIIGNCIFDEAGRIYEDDEYLYISAPCFWGNEKEFEYSGYLQILFAKLMSQSKAYKPLFASIDKKRIDILGVNAASSKKGHKASNLCDYDSTTVWKAKNDASFTVNLNTENVSGIVLINGDRSSNNSYFRNGRARMVHVEYGDKLTADYMLDTEDKVVTQRLSAGKKLKNINSITVTLYDVEPGTDNSNIAVSEVFVY